MRDAFVHTLGLRPDHFQFTSINSHKTRIMVNGDENHSKVTTYLADVLKANFFIYTPREQKPKNFLIKNILDSSYEPQDIVDSINDLKLEINIISIKRFETSKSKKENRQLNIWLIQVDPNSKDLKKFQSIKFLLNTVISIETLKPSGPIQCKNCQRFHHTAANCRMPYRCLKCTLNHKFGECSLITKENDLDKIQCVNCMQFGHPSNYRGCPKAKEILGRISIRKSDTSNPNNNKFTSTKIQENISFAKMVKSGLPSTHQNSMSSHNTFHFLNDELNKHFGMNWSTFSGRVSNFLKEYNNMSTEDKKPALLEFALCALNNFASL